jgi:hypothetical protein
MRRKRILLLIAALLVVAMAAPFTQKAAAALKEEKIYIYIICDRSLKSQDTFSRGFFNAFTRLGFSDQMRLQGVTWVEGDYRRIPDITSFLEIGRDDLVYLGVVSTDSRGGIVRELCRERCIVDPDSKPEEIWSQAEQKCHKFYFEVREILENLRKPQEKKRQKAMMNPYAQKSLSVKVSLKGKDIKSLLGSMPYQREDIDVIMVPSSPKLWKALGITQSSESSYRGGRQLTLKKGKKKLVFEARGTIEKGRIYSLDYSGAPSRTFILPVHPDFSYPEIRSGRIQVPIKLIVNVLLGDTYVFTQKSLDEAEITGKK